MKILFLINSYPPRLGGAEKLVESLSAIFSEWEHKCIVITRWIKNTPLTEHKGNLRIFRIPCIGPRMLRSLIFRSLASILLVLLRSSYDIIHAHSLDSPAAVSTVVGPLLGKTVFITIHNTGKVEALKNRRGGRRSLSRIIKNSRGLISINSEITAELEKAGCQKNKIAFIQNGVDTEFYVPSNSRVKSHKTKEMGFSERKIYIFVGNFHNQKGIDILLEAWSIFQREYSAEDCILLLIGDGVLSDTMKELASSFDIERTVHFLGERNDVRKYLDIACVFIQPSRWEGLSLALLEALASKTAVVATPVGGTKEIINDGVNGLLTPVDNAAALASKLGFLNENPEVAEYLSKNGRKTIEVSYSIYTCAEKHLHLFSNGIPERKTHDLNAKIQAVHSSTIECDQRTSRKETEKIPG